MAKPQQHSESTFERALRDFKTGLTLQELNDFAGTTLRDLQITIATIQRRQASTSTMQYLKRIEGFLEAMESNARITEIFLNVHNFIAFIWGPMKFLLQV